MKQDKLKWFNRIHKKFNKHFEEILLSTLHNLLWQVIINQTMKGKSVVFYPVVTENGYEMVIACSTGGYNETGVLFSEKSWDKCNTICEQISLLAFHKDIGGTLEDIGDYEKIMSKSFGYTAKD